ncbi:MAG TPA: pyruvate, phosphate dikinase [Candidatus Polarisedimenticolia bacterium]|jgi:pyruvate,orthophosphate dikinase
MSDRVYFFGGGTADGSAGMKDLLGGKGANLAEMTNLGIPVPPGFTITTEVCNDYFKTGAGVMKSLASEIDVSLERMGALTGPRFGDAANPLLVSVRSGARSSMPGMMETVLNVGLTRRTRAGLIERTANPRFVLDAYRRLMMMYADVVMEKAQGIEPAEGDGVRPRLEREMSRLKKARGVTQDTDLTAPDLERLIESFHGVIRKTLGRPFPDDPKEQLQGAIEAVFRSWNGKRAISYRRIEGIPDDWGTAVNVQAMVFGNTGERSATGVGFTRNPATGENLFYGEWLPNAQGEDVVAGIRTPRHLTRRQAGESGSSPERHAARRKGLPRAGKWSAADPPVSAAPTLEEAMPEAYAELERIRDLLERHYRDMQDIEFTIQEGKVWMLQTRTGKRTGPAAVRIAVEMCESGLIAEDEALLRVRPEQLDELLHRQVDPKAEARLRPLARGLPAGPGAGTGVIATTAEKAEIWAKKGKKVVLVRAETSPEDVHGMHVAEAIVTAKGGMTSHAALVARGWGKCCVVGCGELDVDSKKGVVRVGGRTLKEGELLTVNGTRGAVYAGTLPLLPADPEKNPHYRTLMKWADARRRLRIRANADRPEDAAQARAFGAEGIGLTRTEHMFFDAKRIQAMREMIVAAGPAQRRRALMKLLPFQRRDFEGILKAMAGLPVTIRLLDPPLHEFVNLAPSQIAGLARSLKVSPRALAARIDQLHELNPMLGHRGCRLGITYPEISEMQARAIFEATASLRKKGIKAIPEVMIPLVGTVTELSDQEQIVRRVAKEVREKTGVDFPFTVGTMIEVPRACLTAGRIASAAEFFSFGTNDLTQTTYGFSRDDIGSFLPYYLEKKILPADPFQSIDVDGVGALVQMAVKDGRAARPGLKIGICGEHGGDPASVGFFHRAGLDYVSCSPFRIPIARLAAAHAALREQKAEAVG